MVPYGFGDLIEDLKNRLLLRSRSGFAKHFHYNGFSIVDVLSRKTRPIESVLDRREMLNIERLPCTFRKQEDRALRPDRLAYSELVRNFCISKSQIRPGVGTKDQPLEHRLVNESVRRILLCPQRLQVRFSNC